MKDPIQFLTIGVALMLNATVMAHALDNKFTYQGRLMDNSSPATASYQMQFRLRDGPSDASAVLATAPPQTVSVVDGLFSAPVDFPVVLFDGNDRWLEISVATPATPGAFTVLLPRQKITPTPYALYAAKAGMLEEAANQVFTGTVAFNPTPVLPPFQVGSSVKVQNLNADLIDGKDASEFSLKADQCVANLAELKNKSPGFTRCVSLLGYASPGDGGGGLFYWDASATEADNGGTIIEPMPTAPGRWKRLVNGPLSVRWFGAKGDDLTDDRAAFVRAIAAAMAGNYPLYLPKSTYFINAVTAFITINGDLVMTGDGPEQTRIRFGPDMMTQSLGGFVTTGSANVTYREIHFEGPANPGTKTFNGLYHTSAGRMRLEHCRTSKFSHPVKADNGGIVELRASDLSGSSQNVLFVDAVPGGRLHCFNSTFNIVGIGGGQDPQHNIYANSGVSVLISDCVFESNGDGYAVNLYGGAGAAEYAMVANCTFKPAIKEAILCNDNAKTQIDNCSFNLSPVRSINAVGVRSKGAILRGCHFLGGSLQYCIFDESSVDGSLIIDACSFDFSCPGALLLKWKAGAGPWLISNCQFRQTGTGDLLRLAQVPGDLRLSSCSFELPTSGGDAFGLLGSGRVTVDRCSFTGTRGIFANGTGGDLQIVLRDCRLETTDPGSGLWLNDVGPGTITVRGDGNQFLGPAAGPRVDTSAVTPRGWLRPPSEIGATMASAAVVSVSPNASTIHITGSVPIQTIKVQGTGAEALFHGPIHLIADGNWATEITGNIKPRKTIPRTTNEAVIFIYDAGTNFWYEL